MTRPDRDYDDIIRRALHSIADPIEPTGDGLARIREHLAEPWLWRQLSLLRTECADAAWLIAVRCEPFLDWARPRVASATRAMAGGGRRAAAQVPALAIGAAWAVYRWCQRVASSPRLSQPGARQRLGAILAWLRPALAVAAAVIIVVAGAFALTQIRQTITSISQITGLSKASPDTAARRAHHGGGMPSPPAVVPHQGTASQQGAAKHGGRHPAKVPCSPSASSAPNATPSPTATSPSPSPTISPTPTGSPTPTDSGTPSPTPSGVGGTVSPGGFSLAANPAGATVGADSAPASCGASSPPTPSPSATAVPSTPVSDSLVESRDPAGSWSSHAR